MIVSVPTGMGEDGTNEPLDNGNIAGELVDPSPKGVVPEVYSAASPVSGTLKTCQQQVFGNGLTI